MKLWSDIRTLLLHMKPKHGKPTPRTLKWVNLEGAAGPLDEKQSFHLWSQAESFFLLFNEEVFFFFSGNCLCVLWKFTIIISVHGMDSFPKGHKVGKPMYPSAIICTTFDCLQSIFTTICHRTQFILSKSFSRNSALLENMSASVPSKLKPLNCGSHQKMITVVFFQSQ